MQIIPAGPARIELKPSWSRAWSRAACFQFMHARALPDEPIDEACVSADWRRAEKNTELMHAVACQI